MRSFAMFALVACGTSPPSQPDGPTGFCTDRAPVAPTFTNVRALIEYAACRECHHTGVELDLSPDVSYANLVGRTPPNYMMPMTDESCGIALVTPGDPTRSYLYQKLSSAMPCAGTQMPLNDLGIPAPLTTCEVALVHDWIAAGAAND